MPDPIFSLPNKEEVLNLIEKEYDILLRKMNSFYQAKKAWLELTADQFAENVEHSQLAKQYQELKISWQEQQNNWKMLIHQYA